MKQSLSRPALPHSRRVITALLSGMVMAHTTSLLPRWPYHCRIRHKGKKGRAERELGNREFCKSKHSAVYLSALNKNSLALQHTQEESPIPWTTLHTYCQAGCTHCLTCFWAHSFPHTHSNTPSSSSSTLQLLQHKYITRKAEF